jgi:hypothetical protein
MLPFLKAYASEVVSLSKEWFLSWDRNDETAGIRKKPRRKDRVRKSFIFQRNGCCKREPAIE